MDYENFQIKDFMLDEFFLQWCEGNNLEANEFWENWMILNPAKKKLIQEAKRLYELMDFAKVEMPNSKIESNLIKIHSSIDQSEQSDTIIGKRSIGISGNILKVAAVFVVAITMVLLYYIYLNAVNTSYSTEYGEIKTVVLPDQSVVKLNGNSSIRFSKHLNSEEKREVWISGEAFFTVVHTRSHKKFIVHSETLNVEVLGTTFNVNNRQGVTKVVLSSGKVKLNDQEADRSLIMKPGQLVEYYPENGKFVRKTIVPEIVTSWKNNQLIFSKASLISIAQTLEDIYGFKIEFANKDLANKKFTGSIHVKDVEILITSIAESFNLNVIRNDREIVFVRK